MTPIIEMLDSTHLCNTPRGVAGFLSDEVCLDIRRNVEYGSVGSSEPGEAVLSTEGSGILIYCILLMIVIPCTHGHHCPDGLFPPTLSSYITSIKLLTMKKLLVPTDFSPASHRASTYAAALAKEFNAELYLLHVYMAPATAGEMSPAWAVIDQEMQEEIDIKIQREVAILQSTYRIKVNGDARIGMELPTINAVAHDIKADLIVMGMKGGGRNKRIGSITVATIRKSKVPVLVVPEHAHFIPIRKITLATDFSSKLNDSCFKVLFEIARQFRAHLQVLHVAEDSQDMNQDEIAGKMQLEVMLSRVSHSYHVIEEEEVEEGITKFIHDRTPDLLVMVAHRHFILDRLFGSVYTRSLSYKTRLPLLVLEDKK